MKTGIFAFIAIINHTENKIYYLKILYIYLYVVCGHKKKHCKTENYFTLTHFFMFIDGYFINRKWIFHGICNGSYRCSYQGNHIFNYVSVE